MKDKKQRDESKIKIALEYSNAIIITLREPFSLEVIKEAVENV